MPVAVDRPDMRLPKAFDDLVDAVAAANSNTCVVVQSGTQCEMPWVDKVPAIVQVSRLPCSCRLFQLTARCRLSTEETRPVQLSLPFCSESTIQAQSCR